MLVFFLGLILKTLRPINIFFFLHRLGVGAGAVIKNGFISLLELVLQSGRHLREFQNLTFPTILCPRIPTQNFNSFHCRGVDSDGFKLEGRFSYYYFFILLFLYFLRWTYYLAAQVQFYVLFVFLNLAMPCGHR